jgi:hypothetical protein
MHLCGTNPYRSFAKTEETKSQLTIRIRALEEKLIALHLRRSADESSVQEIDEEIAAVSAIKGKFTELDEKLAKASESVIGHKSSLFESTQYKTPLHQCDECGKVFKAIGNRTAHLRTHTGERPFPCSLCNRRFKQKYHLRRHERTHRGEKPFKCDECSCTFADQSALSAHSMTHSAERFPCDRCSHVATSKANLLVHHAQHKCVKAHECSMCRMSFATHGELSAHRRRAHVTTMPLPLTSDDAKRKFPEASAAPMTSCDRGAMLGAVGGPYTREIHGYLDLPPQRAQHEPCYMYIDPRHRASMSHGHLSRSSADTSLPHLSSDGSAGGRPIRPSAREDVRQQEELFRRHPGFVRMSPVGRCPFSEGAFHARSGHPIIPPSMPGSVRMVPVIARSSALPYSTGFPGRSEMMSSGGLRRLPMSADVREHSVENMVDAVRGPSYRHTGGRREATAYMKEMNGFAEKHSAARSGGRGATGADRRPTVV